MIRPDDSDKMTGKAGRGAPPTQPIVNEAYEKGEAGSDAPSTQPSREFAEAISRRTGKDMGRAGDTTETQKEMAAATGAAGSKGGDATKGSAHSSRGSAPTAQPSREFAEAIRKRTAPMNFPQEELKTEERETGDNASVMPVGGRHAPGALDPEGEERLRQQEAQELADAVKGTDDNINLLQKWLDEHPRLTKEQRERLARREKSRRLMASVGDGLSALGSLFFTTQYSPELFDARRGQAAQVDARQEKLRAQREREADRYMNFALRLGDLKNGRATTLRELKAQHERQKLAREKAQQAAEQHHWLALLQPGKQREQAGKASKAEQEAIAAQAVAEAAPELQQAKIATERARKGSLDASAANSRASAAAHNRSNVSEFTAWDEHGNPHSFRTKEAAEAYAKQHGTWKEEDKTETTTTKTRRTPESKPQQRTSTKTTKGGHAGKPSPTGRQSPTA